MSNVTALAPELRICYRIVWTELPSLEDFEPNFDRGVRSYLVSDETIRLQSGISVFRTLSQARRTARSRRPWMGQGFVAMLEIPLGMDARIERTTKSAGHYTLWADAHDILRWVTQVYPVSPQEDE